MKIDMSQEKPPARRVLLPEGWRLFKIIDAKEETSKAGNPMIVFNLQDSVTLSVDNVYCVNVAGKRWTLKEILTACKIPAGEDGVYDWEIKDVLGMDIEGLIKHEPKEFINREGVTVKTTQHRIVEYREHSNNPDGVKTPADIAWEE